MDAPQTTAQQHAFQQRLAQEGLLIPSSVRGVTGQGSEFVRLRQLLDASITRLAAGEDARTLEFPPIEPRRDMESVGYLASFPQLAGSVFAFQGTEVDARTLGEKAHAHEDWSGHLNSSEVVLVPAACHPVYPALASFGPLPEGGTTVDTGAAWVFRHEPSDDPCRLQAFHMRELVRCDEASAVVAWRDTWRDRALAFVKNLGLAADVDEAHDPFFGRSGRILARNQREQGLKFELLVPVGGDGPTAIASFNAHADHFTSVFGLSSATGQPVHTACLGFGLERVVLALLWTHGTDVGRWPTEVLAELGA